MIDTIPYQIQVSFLLILSGFFIRQALLIVGQNWAYGYHHLLTYILLPNIAYVITSVIANNIALSLGMIGALSIIRFRNPVKSPLELVIFFGLLTLGVAASVHSNFSILLFVIMILSIFLTEIYNIILKKFGLFGYQVSFNEGVSLNILEVSSKKEIDFITNSKNLKNFNVNEDNTNWNYRLGFLSKKEMEGVILKLKDLDYCSIEVQYNL